MKIYKNLNIMNFLLILITIFITSSAYAQIMVTVRQNADSIELTASSPEGITLNTCYPKTLIPLCLEECSSSTNCAVSVRFQSNHENLVFDPDPTDGTENLHPEIEISLQQDQQDSSDSSQSSACKAVEIHWQNPDSPSITTNFQIIVTKDNLTNTLIIPVNFVHYHSAVQLESTISTINVPEGTQAGNPIPLTVEVQNNGCAPAHLEVYVTGDARCTDYFSVDNAPSIEPGRITQINLVLYTITETRFSCTGSGICCRVKIADHIGNTIEIPISGYVAAHAQPATFNLVEYRDPWIMNCISDTECYVRIPFEVSAYATDCAEEDLFLLNGLKFEVTPVCQAIPADVPYVIPSNYGSLWRVNVESPCNIPGESVCTLVISVEPGSIHWIDRSTCLAGGILRIEAYPSIDNIARCRNIPKIAIVNGTETIVPSNDAVEARFELIPSLRFPNGGTLYFSTTVGGQPIALVFPILEDVPNQIQVPDLSGLQNFSLQLKIIDVGISENSKVVVLDAYLVDNQGNVRRDFPSVLEVQNIYWDVQQISGAAPSDFNPNSSTKLSDFRNASFKVPINEPFKFNLKLIAQTKYNTGQEIIPLEFTSNTLYLSVPNSCPPNTVNLTIEVPPRLHPPKEQLLGSVASRRPILTGLTNDSIPDYRFYSGNPCPTCLPNSSRYVDGNYWFGGAAKEGTWFDWVDDPTKGQAGYIIYRFVNVIPWDVYFMCPTADRLEPTNYDACINIPNDEFDCRSVNPDWPAPSGPNYWILAWTVEGWQCLREVCVPQVLPNNGAIDPDCL